MTAFSSLLFMLTLICSQAGMLAQQEDEIDWADEIDLLGKELTRRHPNLFFQVDSATFFRDLKHIARESAGHTPFEISVRLQQVLARMGDAQTLINYHFNVKPELILPIDCYWFQDGIYILKAPAAYQQILGKKVVSFNESPIREVIDSLTTLIVHDNPSVVMNQVPKMITWTQLLTYFGFTGHKGLELGVVDQKGHKETVYISLPLSEGEMVSVNPDRIPLGFRNQKTFFLDHYFPSEKLYFIQYNSGWSREVEEKYGSGASALFMPSFKEFEKEVFRVIRKKPIRKLVFDMRFNSGGNAAQGTRFIKKICKSKLRGEGIIYVAIGRKTSCSGIINTVDFMKLAEVITIGEETGGRPNHFGEIERFILPESKLVVNYSTKYFNLLEEDIPSITPQLEAPISFSQYMNGIDPVLESIRIHSSE